MIKTSLMTILAMIMSTSMTLTGTVAAINPVEEEVVELAMCYDEESLYWLSRVIYAESGNNSDELQLAVGSVVLNRCDSPLYPDTIKDVIFDTHWGIQYGCIRNGMIYKEPDQRAIDNTLYLLENGSVLPKDVLAQCDVVVWGNHYKTIDGVVFSRYTR